MYLCFYAILIKQFQYLHRPGNNLRKSWNCVGFIVLHHLNSNNVVFKFCGLIFRLLAVCCTSCVSSHCHLERVHLPFRAETSPFLTIQDIPEGCIA
jgi:hypothetical protein